MSCLYHPAISLGLIATNEQPKTARWWPKNNVFRVTSKLKVGLCLIYATPLCQNGCQPAICFTTQIEVNTGVAMTDGYKLQCPRCHHVWPLLIVAVSMFDTEVCPSCHHHAPFWYFIKENKEIKN